MYAQLSLCRMLSVVSLSLALLSLALDEATAQTLAATHLATTSTRASHAAATDVDLARDWGLSTDEWAHYQDIVRGPLAIYSPTLDPLSALGIESRTEAERNHYAELQVRAEAQRVQKELAYQQAYDAAWKRLYPQLQPIQLPAASTSSASAGPTTGRLAVFVKDGCVACDARIHELQRSGTPFDIYVIGTQHDDARIRAWATRVGLNVADVRSGAITLNHDAGRWLSLGRQDSLPAEVRVAQGTGVLP